MEKKIFGGEAIDEGGRTPHADKKYSSTQNRNRGIVGNNDDIEKFYQQYREASFAEVARQQYDVCYVSRLVGNGWRPFVHGVAWVHGLVHFRIIPAQKLFSSIFVGNNTFRDRVSSVFFFLCFLFVFNSRTENPSKYIIHDTKIPIPYIKF